MKRKAIRLMVAAALTAALVALGSSGASARCVTVGADSLSRTVCGLP